MTKNLKIFSNLRDLESEIILGNLNNKDKPNRFININFNLAYQRRKPFLYLTVLYDYVYYLINRSWGFLLKKQNLKILENYKIT